MRVGLSDKYAKAKLASLPMDTSTVMTEDTEDESATIPDLKIRDVSPLPSAQDILDRAAKRRS